MQPDTEYGYDDAELEVSELNDIPCVVCGSDRPFGRLSNTCSTGCILELRSQGQRPTRVGELI